LNNGNIYKPIEYPLIHPLLTNHAPTCKYLWQTPDMAYGVLRPHRYCCCCSLFRRVLGR